MKRENIWNVPNLLTMLRIALIGAFIWVFFRGERLVALGIFLLAAFTDFLDGYIARRYNLITDFGKLMDPLADKLMMISALSCLHVDGLVPLWVVLVIAGKELMMMIGGAVLLRAGVIVYARLIGKVATVVFMIAITLAFFHEAVAPVDAILLYAAVGLSLCAMVFYGASMIRGWRERA